MMHCKPHCMRVNLPKVEVSNKTFTLPVICRHKSLASQADLSQEFKCRMLTIHVHNVTKLQYSMLWEVSNYHTSTQPSALFTSLRSKTFQKKWLNVLDVCLQLSRFTTEIWRWICIMKCFLLYFKFCVEWDQIGAVLLKITKWINHSLHGVEMWLQHFLYLQQMHQHDL